jgi:hypothetical protein
MLHFSGIRDTGIPRMGRVGKERTGGGGARGGITAGGWATMRPILPLVYF